MFSGCGNSLEGTHGGYKGHQEVSVGKKALRIAAVAMAIVAIVSLVALCILAAAPGAVLGVAFLASTVAFIGGTGSTLIALGVTTAVSILAGCLFNTMYKKQ